MKNCIKCGWRPDACVCSDGIKEKDIIQVMISLNKIGVEETIKDLIKIGWDPDKIFLCVEAAKLLASDS
jgi:hypothetical protein